MMVAVAGDRPFDRTRRHDREPLADAANIGGVDGQALDDYLYGRSPPRRLITLNILEPAQEWRVVKQYEARLRSASEFVLPAARLRRLRPSDHVCSCEWFEDDPIVIEAVEGGDLLPVTLPHGLTLADTTEPTERSEEAPLQGNVDPFRRRAMLTIHRSERADRLVDALASILIDPLDDPFTPEIIAVPTRGVERWITQRLSTMLGTSPGRHDGVCANIAFPFPGRLVAGALAAATEVDPEGDPWTPERWCGRC